MLVFVQDRHGKPIMPCDERKARLLLKQKSVKIVKRTPFTIRYLYGCSGYKQPISLGVDAGYKHIGLSAINEKKVLFEAEVELRSDIVDLLSTRRELRRSRRNRNTRYRAPRFDNRKRKDGWLAPSVENRVNQHLKAVAMVHNCCQSSAPPLRLPNSIFRRSRTLKSLESSTSRAISSASGMSGNMFSGETATDATGERAARTRSSTSITRRAVRLAEIPLTI